MNNIFFKNIIRFIVVMMLQIFLFNKMNLFGYLNPFIYIIFIILLPLRTNKLLLLFIAFFTGFTIDYFGNTPGLHTSATLMMAFVRPGLLSALFRKIEFTQNEEPGITKLGLFGFFKYAFILVLVHHFSLFFLEILDFSKLLMILKNSIFSSLLTMCVIYIYLFLFTKNK